MEGLEKVERGLVVVVVALEETEDLAGTEYLEGTGYLVEVDY